MFERPHHQRIEAMLRRLDGDLFAECECGFAGGTAIAMQLDEYRRSDDIDFLCASRAGYRHLREVVFDQGLSGLARKSLPILRQARADQYGIRGVLGDAEAPIKFEIVREARVTLMLDTHRIGNVPLLCRDDLYAEKLLANADRGLDASTMHRDLIDICMMIRAWGPIPASAHAKARDAYGDSIDRALKRVAALLLADDQLRECLRQLDADENLIETIQPILIEIAERE